MGGGSVALAAVLEPVSDLRGAESGQVGELSLACRVGVGVFEVPLAQQVARLLLEAVALLLSVPDGSRQRELLAHAVLVDRTERASAQSLRLQVVRLEPQRLQFCVRRLGEAMVLDDVVQIAEVARVEGDETARAQHRLIAAQPLKQVRVATH